MHLNTAPRWPATFADGATVHNQAQLDAYMRGIPPVVPLKAGSPLDTQMCFAIGGLTRHELELTAARVGIDVARFPNDDELRTEVIEAARMQCGLEIEDGEGGITTYGLLTPEPHPVHNPNARVPIPSAQVVEVAMTKDTPMTWFSMAELCTSHVPRATSIALGEDYKQPHTAELSNTLFYTHWSAYGWIIFCSEEHAASIEGEHPELANLMRLCVKKKHSYLKLDGDAKAVDWLPKFEW